MIALFDLSQVVFRPIRVTEFSSTIIDHIYTSHPEKIIERLYLPFLLATIFLYALQEKKYNEIWNPDHITTRYQCFKNFGEESFITDLSRDLNFILDPI